MAQQDSNDFNINPLITSGTQLSDILNRLNGALGSGRSGSSRPPSIEAGTYWYNTSNPSQYIIKWYDGTVDHDFFLFDTGSSLLSIASGFKIISPELTGTPIAPTPTDNSNHEAIATTQYVEDVADDKITNQPLALPSNNVDLAVESGLYYGYGGAHGSASIGDNPYPTSQLIITITHNIAGENSGIWATQTAQATEPQFNPKYRTKDNGNWSNWDSFITSNDTGSGNGLDADTVDGKHVNLGGGEWNEIINKIPYIRTDGLMDIGRYVDFHTTDSIADYDIRLDCNTADKLILYGGSLYVDSGNVYVNGSLISHTGTTDDRYLSAYNNLGGVRLLCSSTGDNSISQISSTGGWEKHHMLLERDGGVGLYYNGVSKLKTATFGAQTLGTHKATEFVATESGGLQWESGRSRITHNDGGGNCQIRFGNKWDNIGSGDVFTADTSSAGYIQQNIDTENQPMTLVVNSTTNGVTNGDTVTFGTPFYIYHDKISYGSFSVNNDGYITCKGLFDRAGSAGSAGTNVWNFDYVDSTHKNLWIDSTNLGDINVTSPSDYRVKLNVIGCEYGLTEINKLRPISFDYNPEAWDEDIKPAEGHHHSFIAHELQEIIPEAVFGEKDGDEYQTVDKRELIPILVKSIQELSNANDEKDLKIKSLEDDIKLIKEHLGL